MKLAALLLVCALIGGMVGAGVTGRAKTAALRSAGTTAIEVSERASVEVETVAVAGSERKLSYPELYQANIDSVVSINTTITTNIFNQTVENASAGSGFIITQDGYILTNYHVIDGASTVKVTLYSGETHDAVIVGGDKDYDIAVLKIEAAGLKAVTFGDSSQLQVGEDIAVIGNPLGELTFSMSEGIVSSVDRAINVDGTPFNTIQLSAAVNPGNSGGPLFNAYGEVVGIVSAKYSSYASTTVEGLGFAIPINDVIAMVEDIMENGRVTNRPYFAITAEEVTPRRAQQNGYSVSAGVRVGSVEPGGDLNGVKKSYKAGDTATVTVNRDGAELALSLTFDAAPEQTEAPQQEQNNNSYYYNGGDGSFDPWSFFNEFFGNGFGGYYGGNP